MNNINFNKPAVVRYNAKSNCKFTKGKLYEAYFIEYWEGERTSLHVRGNDSTITDFNHLEDFEIISDEGNLLNNYEATVQCITHKYDHLICGITFGKEYKVIGRDKNGLLLVMDDSYSCYFYPNDVFKIINDPYGILTKLVFIIIFVVDTILIKQLKMNTKLILCYNYTSIPFSLTNSVISSTRYSFPNVCKTS